MITHYIQYKHKEIMVPLFKSLVRPFLEYGNAVWAPCVCVCVYVCVCVCARARVHEVKSKNFNHPSQGNST